MGDDEASKRDHVAMKETGKTIHALKSFVTNNSFNLYFLLYYSSIPTGFKRNYKTVL